MQNPTTKEMLGTSGSNKKKKKIFNDFSNDFTQDFKDLNKRICNVEPPFNQSKNKNK